MYKIIVLSEAQDDLDNIYSYIAEDNILYATKTIREVWQTFQMIKDFPYLWKWDNSLREFVETKYKFRIIYSVNEEEQIITVIAVFKNKNIF